MRLDWASYEAAKYAVEHWHYSGTIPRSRMMFVGVWEDEAYIGVVVFGKGASPNLHRPFKVSNTEACELVRIALRAHRTPVTRIVRVALGLLKKKCPELKVVVSFADPNHGHHGGIYQGGNWLYLGPTTPSVEFVAPDGKQWHGRNVGMNGFVKYGSVLRPSWKRSECRPVKLPGKHRYAYCFDPLVRDRLKDAVRPYPKRARSPDGGTPPDQGGGDGSNPIRAHPGEVA